MVLVDDLIIGGCGMTEDGDGDGGDTNVPGWNGIPDLAEMFFTLEDVMA